MRKYQKQTPGLRARSNLARAIGVESGAASHFDLQRALTLRKEDLAILRQLIHENPNDVEVRREMAIGLNLKSDPEDQPDGPSLGLETEARLSIEEAIAMFRELSRQDPSNASATEDLAMAILRRALRDVSSHPARAETELAEPIVLMAGLPTSSSGRNRQIGLLYTALAQAYDAQSRTTQALAALDKAESLFGTEKSGDKFLQEDWLTFRRVRGRVLLHQGRTAPAIAEFNRRWQELAPGENVASENIEVAFDLAGTAGDLAAAYAAAGDASASSIWLDRKAKIWTAWQGKYPATDRRLQISDRPSH